MTMIVVPLGPTEKEFLSRKVAGGGGFQGLLRMLQGGVKGNRLVLSPAEARRLVRYAETYGEGGFQQRLRAVVEAVKAQLGPLSAEDGGQGSLAF